MRILHSIFFVACMVFFGCSGNDKAISDAAAVNDQLLASSWRIHYFFSAGVDYTNQYSGYTFIFKKDSTVMLSAASAVADGRWYTQKLDDGTIKFSISNFSAQWQPLNNGWKIAGNDGTLIILKDYLATSNNELHFIRQ